MLLSTLSSALALTIIVAATDLVKPAVIPNVNANVHAGLGSSSVPATLSTVVVTSSTTSTTSDDKSRGHWHTYQTFTPMSRTGKRDIQAHASPTASAPSCAKPTDAPEADETEVFIWAEESIEYLEQLEVFQSQSRKRGVDEKEIEIQTFDSWTAESIEYLTKVKDGLPCGGELYIWAERVLIVLRKAKLIREKGGEVTAVFVEETRIVLEKFVALQVQRKGVDDGSDYE